MSAEPVLSATGQTWPRTAGGWPQPLRRATLHWPVLWLAVLLSVLMLLAGGWMPADRGGALFTGRSPLVGRLDGHVEHLPAQALVCANCHQQRSGPVPGFGPVLNADQLTRPLVRRGAPASAYNAASFCRLLRTGVDPAFVLLQRAMPRYELGDAECQALWRHLVAG